MMTKEIFNDKQKQNYEKISCMDARKGAYGKIFQDNLFCLGDLFDGLFDERKNDDCYTKFNEILETMPVDFGGPSIYFHVKAIKYAKNPETFLKKEHLKMIYAVLPAWGMHRMTESTKIIDFREFSERTGKISLPEIKTLEQLNTSLKSGNDEDIEKIAILISSLRINERREKREGEDNKDVPEKTFLVSSSKTLHHIFPDLIPPIDRAYSLKFMKRKPVDFSKQTPNISWNSEICFAKLFIKKMCEFVYTEDREKNMLKMIEKDVQKQQFNTSIPKLFDNLIIAYVKFVKRYPELFKRHFSEYFE